MGLLVALHKPGVSESVRQLVALLEGLGIEVVMTAEVANLLDRQNATPVEELAKTDTLIALGGDGCVLSAARLAAPHNVPILGVRIGGFGFLAEVELDHLEDAFKKFISGEFYLDERMMLQAELWHGENLVWSAIGLNDAVILKSPVSPLPLWEVFVNDELLARYPADGVAIATPTGSTAYTLSAGGPVLAPDVDSFLLMPMYAHTLTLRPLVLPSKAKVTVKLLPQRRPVEGEISVDGQVNCQVLPTHHVLIFRAPFKAQIVRFYGSSFYERLRQKLRWGERQ
ncbi:MAG: NAD(+)/NADH kinase [Armatimonadetes bacterium]|nr:NAD(+)/NADH kinase [Armatimonadota bacterium]MCX7968379.1 NAD(+)/NADH kinase [Armatimonadota bacterium]MDW8143490.1 NAD(+)/NADH kinase [Armatimonadota bacterium]